MNRRSFFAALCAPFAALAVRYGLKDKRKPRIYKPSDRVWSTAYSMRKLPIGYYVLPERKREAHFDWKNTLEDRDATIQRICVIREKWEFEDVCGTTSTERILNHFKGQGVELVARNDGMILCFGWESMQDHGPATEAQLEEARIHWATLDARQRWIEETTYQG